MGTPLQAQLEERLRRAVVEAVGPEHAAADPMLRPATQPQFGDYQANLAMGLAKRVGQPPRALAESIVAHLDCPGLIATADVAGPGFINLKLEDEALGQRAAELLADPRLGIQPADPRERIVVDYSAPNVAKEMHIGHLRSTVIGDAIVRVLGALGHEVIRQNHIGDWGTQFGMLLEYLDENTESATRASLELGELNAFYQAAKTRFDADPDFVRRSRERVVRLQGGEPATLAQWKLLVEASLHYFESVYARMDVLLEPSDVRGESAYNEALPEVLAALADVGLLRESDGAQVVYPEGFLGKDAEPLPMIVQKSDGGYLYATTDLAAARYRLDVLEADRVIYLCDARQSQHFSMLFQTLRQAGWVREGVRLDYVPFGMILGSDRKPFKTREGGSVRLASVIDEAEERARAVIAEKNPALDSAARAETGRIVGIGALKYADLSSDRIKDYVFDWDRMLALDGNTAPYLINAYVRIRSIFRKAGCDLPLRAEVPIRVDDEAERALVLKLLEFSAVVRSVADSLEPHRLCTFLYELAALYHRFYERCPVLKAEPEALRESRLALCALVARTLARGLELLGIRTVERM